MTKNERDAMDQLDRYWDALVAGRADAEDTVDPTLAATLQTLHRADDAPPPSRAFLDRLQADIERAAGTTVVERARMTSIPRERPPLPQPPARPEEVSMETDAPARPRRFFPGWLQQGMRLAGAALVLLIVAIGGLAIREMARDGGHPASPSPAPLPLIASAGEFDLMLFDGHLTGDRLTLILMISLAGHDQMIEIDKYGEYVGPIPPEDIELTGLALAPSAEDTPREPTEGGGRVAARAAYLETLRFTLTGDTSDPVSITIKQLPFQMRDGSANIIPGPWRFEFVPADLLMEKEGLSTIDPVIERLREAGLVFEINETVEVSGQEITLLRLAADRDITYLIYSTSDGRPAAANFTLFPMGLSRDGLLDVPTPYRDGLQPPWVGTSTPAPAERWTAFSGLPVGLDEIRVELMPTMPSSPGGQGGLQHVTVPLDLEPLRAIHPATPLSASATANGVEVRATTLSRGVAVTMLELTASVVDPAALVAVDDTTVRAEWNQEVRAEVDGTPVPVIGGDAESRNGVATRTIRLFNLPTEGTLRLTLDWQYVNYISGAESIPFARGPFELVIELE